MTVQVALEPYVAKALPAKEPATANEVQAMIAERVADLPGVASQDPDDRYGLRALTGAWLGGLTHNTRRAYWRGLAEWLGYCDWHRLDPLSARAADIKDWLAWLDPASASAYNLALAGVTSWYTELGDNRVHNENPAKIVKRRKRSKGSLTRAMDETELISLLRYARARAARLDSEAALRGLAILEIMGTTAVRSGAILHARCGADGDLGHSDGHRVLHYVNKGGEHKTADILGLAERALHAYLDRRAEREHRDHDELTGHLFVTTKGTPLTSRDLSHLVRDYAAAAGITDPEEVVPHSLRHTVLKVGYAHGIDLIALADLAGHDNIHTTANYIRRSHQRHTTETMATIVTPAPVPVPTAVPAPEAVDPTPADARHLRVVR